MKRAATTVVTVALAMLAVPAFANHPVPIAGQPQVPTTTSTTTSTTVATTTTTTPVAPVSPPVVDPPPAILSGRSGQVTGELGSWCWPQPNGQTLCRALSRNAAPDPVATLAVTQGETLTLRIETAVPVADLRIGVWTGGPPSPLISAPVANPSRFPINLAPGRHVIGVRATFQGMGTNSVEYEFEVMVRTAGRTISLTG